MPNYEGVCDECWDTHEEAEETAPVPVPDPKAAIKAEIAEWTAKAQECQAIIDKKTKGKIVNAKRDLKWITIHLRFLEYKALKSSATPSDVTTSVKEQEFYDNHNMLMEDVFLKTILDNY
jgi:hypothetical protein